MVYTLRFFSLQNAVCFIILTYLVPVLFIFYIQGVLKFKKNNSGAKRLSHTIWARPGSWTYPSLVIPEGCVWGGYHKWRWSCFRCSRHDLWHSSEQQTAVELSAHFGSDWFECGMQTETGLAYIQRYSKRVHIVPRGSIGLIKVTRKASCSAVL